MHKCHVYISIHDIEQCKVFVVLAPQDQSWSWVGSIHGLGWVGLSWVGF